MMKIILAVLTIFMMQPAHAQTKTACDYVYDMSEWIMTHRFAGHSPEYINTFPSSAFGLGVNEKHVAFKEAVVPYLIRRSLAHPTPEGYREQNQLQEWFADRMKRDCQMNRIR